MFPFLSDEHTIILFLWTTFARSGFSSVSLSEKWWKNFLKWLCWVRSRSSQHICLCKASSINTELKMTSFYLATLTTYQEIIQYFILCSCILCSCSLWSCIVFDCLYIERVIVPHVASFIFLHFPSGSLFEICSVPCLWKTYSANLPFVSCPLLCMWYSL